MGDSFLFKNRILSHLSDQTLIGSVQDFWWLFFVEQNIPVEPLTERIENITGPINLKEPKIYFYPF